MKRSQLHVGWILLLALILWWLVESKPDPRYILNGEVTLGDPVVKGSGSEAYGGTDYSTRPRVADDPRMQELIDESNALLDPSSRNSPQPPGGT
jgi:hypothetical protein